MDVISVDIQVSSFYDKENNCWVIKSNEYNIVGYGANIIQAKKMFMREINEILKPNQTNNAQTVNELQNNFRELRGQLISYGLKKNSLLISSIDIIISNNKIEIN